MVVVTENAKKKFKETIRDHAKDSDIAVRIKYTPSGENQVEFMFDKEKEGDYTIKDAEGTKLILVAPDSLSALKGAIIGYQNLYGFIIEKFSTDMS